MDVSREEKIKAWNCAIGLNKINGAYQPSKELLQLIEKEVNEEITTEEMVNIIIAKCTKK